MDYIYKDINGKKKVGEIKYMEVIPYYEFEIQTAIHSITCYLHHLMLEWEIYISSYDETIELAHPRDIYWNSTAINEKVKDEEISQQIAYAIREVYNRNNHKEDVPI